MLSVALQGLADWTYDRQAEAAFNVAVWTIPISSALMLFFNIPSVVLVVLLAGFWIVSMASFPYALLTLSRSIALSVAHAHEHQERLCRRQARAEEEAERYRSTVAAMDKGQD